MLWKFLTDDVKRILKDTFKDLRDDVNIEVYTQDSVNDAFDLEKGLKDLLIDFFVSQYF